METVEEVARRVRKGEEPGSGGGKSVFVADGAGMS